MGLIRKEAVQGHAVPRGPYGAYGPFPPELFARNPRAYDSFNTPEAMPEELYDVQLYRCRYCGEVLYDDELDNHECEEED